MKKKTIFMVMMLVVAMSNPVMAADTENTEDRTEVTYDVDSVYTVVIPESAQLGSDMDITSNSMNIDVNEAVNVYIKEGVENGVMTLKRDFNESTTITADVKLGDKKITDIEKTVVACFKGDDTNPTVGTGTITLGEPNEDYVKAGSYTGTLTFSIKLEDLSA